MTTPRPATLIHLLALAARLEGEGQHRTAHERTHLPQLARLHAAFAAV